MVLNDFMSYFSMKKMPFTSSIGTDFLFRNDRHADIRNKLLLTIQSDAMALLTGRPGTGKSTILRSITSTLSPEQYLVLYVSISNPTPRWLYTVPLQQLGVKSHQYVNDARKQFHDELTIQRKTYNRKVVMVIDEAHLLTHSYLKYALLEEIRFLRNGENYDSGAPLSLILSGQTEICPILQDSRCSAITQRIDYVCSTSPLSDEQVGPYIGAHLRWAGVTDTIFSSAAVAQVAKLSQGNLRMINKICLHSMNYAALKKQSTVSPELVDCAAKNEVIELVLQQIV
jgi:type II secretory pathway predicted ATPase ExeA